MVEIVVSNVILVIVVVAAIARHKKMCDVCDGAAIEDNLHLVEFTLYRPGLTFCTLRGTIGVTFLTFRVTITSVLRM
jgi:hypothetical protein